MKVYHVSVEREGKWFCATAMEDPSVFTQGRSLDEIVENIREVADLLHGEKDVQIELVVPPAVRGAHKSRPVRQSPRLRSA